MCIASLLECRDGDIGVIPRLTGPTDLMTLVRSRDMVQRASLEEPWLS